MRDASLFSIMLHVHATFRSSFDLLMGTCSRLLVPSPPLLHGSLPTRCISTSILPHTSFLSGGLHRLHTGGFGRRGANPSVGLIPTC